MPRVDNLFRTPEQWTRANPILGAGQVGKEKYTGKYKVGDDRTRWNDLSYASGVAENDYFSAWKIVARGLGVNGAELVSKGSPYATLNDFADTITPLLGGTPEYDAWFQEHKNDYPDIDERVGAFLQEVHPEVDRRLNVSLLVEWMFQQINNLGSQINDLGTRVTALEGQP